MLDIKLIREKPDFIRENIKRRQDTEKLEWVDKILDADENWRKLTYQNNDLKSSRNKLSTKVPKVKDKEEKQEIIQRVRKINSQIKSLESQIAEYYGERQYFLDRLPNLLHESVPYGKDETENQEIRRWGKLPEFVDFKPRDHIELMELLDLVDLPRAAKVSGSRFYYLKNEAVLLDFALLRYALEIVQNEGFKLFTVPIIVRKFALYGTGFLPVGEDDIYKIQGNEDLALIGTSEVPLGAYHSDEIIEGTDLPLWYAGFSPSFRTEAGSHGRDTKGIFRVHKFHKIECFKFVRPENSWKEHEHLITVPERLYKSLELHHRVMNICTGDLGSVAAKKLVIEAWLPGQGKFREVVSCSNCTDYQARRLKIRYRDKTHEKPNFLHTLNSTALATNRAMIAILETNQREDGSVAIPKVLWPYTGFKEIIPK